MSWWVISNTIQMICEVSLSASGGPNVGPIKGVRNVVLRRSDVDIVTPVLADSILV